jgi:hypothetical protein
MQCCAPSTELGWRRARPPGAASAPQGCSDEVVPHAPPRAQVGPTGDQHGQTHKRWRGEAGTTPRCGPSPAPLSQQPRGEGPPADAPTGAAPAPVEVTRTGPAMPVCLGSHRPTLSTAATPPLGPRIPSRDAAPIPAVGGDHGHGPGRLQAACGAMLSPVCLIMAPTRIS